MADFSAVLRKTIDGLSENTPQMRAKVYEKARATIESKIAAVTPPPPPAVADRQRQMLEEAIAAVEAEYAEAPAAAEPEEENEFDRIFAEYDKTEEAGAGPAEPDRIPAPPPSTDAPADQASRRHTHESDAWEPAEPPHAAVPPVADQTAELEADNLEAHVTGPEHEHDEFAGLSPQKRESVRARRGQRSWTGVIVALIVLIVLGGAGYGIWLNKAEFANLFGLARSVVSNDEAPGDAAPSEAATGDEAAGGGPETASGGPDAGAQQPNTAEEPDAAAGTAEKQAPPSKFTQRLTPDGEEIDEGPAGGEPTLGEGTSVSTATSASNAAPQTAEQQTVPIGQRAIFYEERTNSAEGSAQTGSVVWSLVEESPGNDLPAEPAIRAEATIPGRDVQLKMTIRRNADPSLPASHIVEMIFLTPDDFEGGGIESVLRIAMKQSEQETGSPLLGVPAKIADGFFLIALNDAKADVETNRTLLRRQEWIDIPIVYKSGRRALITLEKGIPGEKVFDQALDAWQSSSSG